MKHHYLGQLQIEANVPDNDIVNEFINVTVDFEIICPRCGPERHKIKKNGHDTKLEANPQVFYCYRCQKHFFPHTSWIFKEFTTIILEDVMKCLFIDNLSPKSVANKYNISQSLVSKIRFNCFNLLKKKIDFYKSELNLMSDLKEIPLDLLSAIWWDETFFKINGTQYFLILIIDAYGKVLGYKFSKTRQDHDYLSILEPIKNSLPDIPIFICDGAPTYESVVKQLKKESYLIQHIHSKPWEEAKIHHFKPLECGDKIEQHTILLPYDAFTKNKSVIGYVTKKQTIIRSSNIFKKKKGRPKGLKDTKKRAKYGSLKDLKSNRLLQKRGRKNIKKTGIKVSFLPKPRRGFWKVKFLSSISELKDSEYPRINTLSKILTKTYSVMGGRYIQSNLIEVKNSVVKRLINNIGLKTVYQYDYLLGTHFLARGDMDECYWEDSNQEINFSNNIGFNQMLSLFRPDKKEIKVI